MAYFVGAALALGVGVFTTLAGFNRDRALYPVVTIVVASYYALFAAMAGGEALGSETVAAGAFILAAVIGFRTTLWIVVVALVGHGLFDLVHGEFIANPGVPAWWPMFCLGYDVGAGLYLAWLILSKRIDASDRSAFGSRIASCVDAELLAAKAAERANDPSKAFYHLERAHVLGQASTVQHVRVHVRMIMWGLRRRDLREVGGQILRAIGAATMTWAGLVPTGNTGGANVSGLKPMAIPTDLAETIASARASTFNANR